MKRKSIPFKKHAEDDFLNEIDENPADSTDSDGEIEDSDTDQDIFESESDEEESENDLLNGEDLSGEDREESDQEEESNEEEEDDESESDFLGSDDDREESENKLESENEGEKEDNESGSDDDGDNFEDKENNFESKEDSESEDDFQDVEDEESDDEGIKSHENDSENIKNILKNKKPSLKNKKIDLHGKNDNLKANNDDLKPKNKLNDKKKTKIKPKSLKFSENKLKPTKIIKSLPKKLNEYEDHDTSDEEDIRNTIGNVPKNWYDDYKHFGYDWDGKKIIKPETGDNIDGFLKRIEDPDFWRTVKDPQTGQDVVLSDDDINLIKRIQGGKIPDETFEEYAPWIEWFTSEVMEMPVRKFPEHKRSFLPSKNEAKKVAKLVHALKMGWIKTREEEEKLRAKKEPQFYMLWSTDDQKEEMRRIYKHIAAPKRLLPGHAESYNPPPEYLFDEKELKKWNKQKTNPIERKLHFLPQKYDSLRKVPAYSRYIKERFLRCLDLYLCPRAIKMKLTIEPEALVPKLPSPKDLQPFPTVLSIEYKGHTDMVRCITLDKTGQYLASGSDDNSIKIWEVNTGRCLKTIQTEGIIRSIDWCPNNSISLILIASDNKVLLINPNVGDFLISSKTDSILSDFIQGEVIQNDRVTTSVKWINEIPDDQHQIGYRIILNHFKEVTQVTWHGKGDYFASVMPEGQNRSVLISQLSKRRSQLPFSKSKGLVQSVLFHPIRPLLFVATQKHVRVYDLLKQQLIKKLLTNSRWVSTMDIHPGGDNLLVATYDRKILWFDLDLSTKPYQTLRLHGTAVRGVAFHKRYPLFASGSDDRSLIVSHGMVYNDLLKNPLIVPLKRFQDHDPFNDFGIFGVKFHPLQPWLFSSGADGTIKLYTN